MCCIPVAVIIFNKTVIGLFQELTPFNKLSDEPHPNFVVSIPMINLPGCCASVVWAVTVVSVWKI